MEYKEADIADKKHWNILATHPMQTWEWGEFRKQRQQISRLGVYEDEKLVRGYLITWTKLMSWTIGYIPMGPVPDNEDIKKLREYGLKNNAIFIRMEPNGVGKIHLDLPQGKHLFKPQTYLWDLKKSESDLLSAMHQKGRYNIKIAQKNNVEIVEDNSETGLETHIKLLMDTANRQGVAFHSPEYHRQLWKTLKTRIFLAKYNDEILASAMVFVHKDTGYYAYGGNSLAHREVMASTLLVWEIARNLKKDGIKIFDLWGTEEGKGFSQFKEKFGADLATLPGSFDLPVDTLLYPAMRIAEETRARFRKLRK